MTENSPKPSDSKGKHDTELEVPTGVYCRKCGQRWQVLWQVSGICKGGGAVTDSKEILQAIATDATKKAEPVLGDARNLMARVAEVDREIDELRNSRHDLTELLGAILKSYQIVRQSAFDQFLQLVDQNFCSSGDYGRGHQVDHPTRLVYFDYDQEVGDVESGDITVHIQNVHQVCNEHIFGADQAVFISGGRLVLKRTWGLEELPKGVRVKAFSKWFNYYEVQKMLPPLANTIEELQKIVQQPAS